MLGAGERLGRYEVLAELGSGGMADVYLADGPEGRVALKVFRPRMLEAAGLLERFRREAEIGRRIDHDNVVRTLGVEAAGGHDFLVMEYVAGQTLRDLLADLRTVPEELCRHVGREIARGLAAVHAAGAIHRDLKPENVLVTEDHVVKVMDLGLALLRDATRLTGHRDLPGTALYAAPEQFRGEEPDERADLYSLGLVLYELATGRHPFHSADLAEAMHRRLHEHAPPAAELNPQLSPFFEEVLARLLARDAGERFASAAELAQVLDEGERSAWWLERAGAIRTATRAPLRRMRVARTTGFHGRAAELARLRELYERAVAGEGRVVLVQGEAGIGKTRLLDEFVGRLRREKRELHHLFGVFPPGGDAAATSALASAYREHFGAEDPAAALAPYLVTTPRLVPAFAALLRGATGGPGTEALDEESTKTLFVRTARALAAERPTILHVEDLHFAPPGGRALFAALALATPGQRLLLVGTSRESLLEPWAVGLQRQRSLTRLELERLGPEDLTGLLVDVVGSRTVAEEIAPRVAVKSDGNPYFALEIVRSLRNGRRLTAKDVAEARIPSSVAGLIQARIAALGDEERALLDAAACCGFRFDPRLVAEALGLRRIPALKRLGHVERGHHLVRSAGAGFVFDHHQVQEALHESLPAERRRALHAALGEALERQDPDAAVALCRHFLEGGLPSRALRHLDAAFERLDASFRNDAAVALAERALAVPGLLGGTRRLDVLLRLALWLGVTGQPDRAREALDEALALADAAGGPLLRSRARTALARLLMRRAGYAEAEALLRDAAALAREAEAPQEEGIATGTLGAVLVHLGRRDEARALFERHIEIARGIGDRLGEARAVGALGGLASRRGDYVRALEHDREYLALCRDLGHKRLEATATGNLGVVLFHLGRYDEARKHYEEHARLAHEIGDREGEARVTGNLGALFHAAGDLARAVEQAELYLARCREIGYRRGELIAHINLGQDYTELGVADRARHHFEQALAGAREVGSPDCEASALDGLGVLEGSEERFREALGLWEGSGSRGPEAATRILLGERLAAEGRGAEARAEFEKALAIAREVRAGTEILRAAAHLGRADEASAILESPEAVPHSLRMQARFLLWKATGDAAHLDAAKRALDHLRERAPSEWREALGSVPLHREIASARASNG